MGATGLWQFYVSNRIQYNLKNRFLYRMSWSIPSYSCSAKYMSNMYAIFGDWDYFSIL
jgi:hypothetical protein